MLYHLLIHIKTFFLNHSKLYYFRPCLPIFTDKCLKADTFFPSFLRSLSTIVNSSIILSSEYNLSKPLGSVLTKYLCSPLNRSYWSVTLPKLFFDQYVFSIWDFCCTSHQDSYYKTFMFILHCKSNRWLCYVKTFYYMRSTVIVIKSNKRL